MGVRDEGFSIVGRSPHVGEPLGVLVAEDGQALPGDKYRVSGASN